MRPQKVFQVILFAYPRAFRHEYGIQMTQLFRDCYRTEKVSRGLPGVGGLWFRTLLDLARAAPREHLETLRKDNAIMRNLRHNALALLGSVAIIAIALWLLSYGRKHEVSSILLFGYALDAIVAAGIVGNLIVFLLMTLTRLNPLRIALWTLLAVNAALLLVAVIIGSKVDPGFRLVSVVAGYVASFLFWFGLYWIWSKGDRDLSVSSER